MANREPKVLLKIYGTIVSSNVQKVLWCCAEIGVPFERLDIVETFGAQRAPGYLALNPNGLMPTIDDDGFILWESNAIVRYLCAKHSLGRLCPSSLAERADAERWMDWQQTSLAPQMGPLFRALLRNPREELPADRLAVAMQKAGDLWRMLDARLASHEYVCGASLTMADLALGNAVHRWYKFAIEHPDLPHLRAWYDRLCERPAYRTHVASI
jgi:glutathione S-transferase